MRAYAEDILGKHIRPLEKAKRQEKFLDYLRRSWTVPTAARQAEIPMRTLYHWKENDETFAEEWDEAYKEGTANLEDVARRRGFEGTLKPVYQQGRRVGTIREYSDAMAALILKKRDPAFKDRVQHEGTGEGGAFVILTEREKKI